jgi:proline iminopeptidase
MSEVLYPPSEALKSGYLTVSKNPPHELYWEEHGNPDGAPVMVVHGGPGAGCSPKMAQFFDPDHYRIILFDQRGAGKSKPFASLEKNTTGHLVGDMMSLRQALGIEGKMHVFGGSWGSTLALAYAIGYPETVQSLTLRGIFLCRKQDIDIFYQQDAADPGNPALMGVGRFFPEAWKPYVDFIPPAERHDMVAAYHKRLTSSDEAVKLEAALRWTLWEGATSYLIPDIKENFSDPAFALPFARIENHYFMHGAFLAPDNIEREQNFIIDYIRRIASIPTEIAQGRYDMVCPRNQADDLCAAWNAAQPDPALRPKLHIIDDAGHSQWEPGITKKLVEITNRFRELDKALVPAISNNPIPPPAP